MNTASVIGGLSHGVLRPGTLETRQVSHKALLSLALITGLVYAAIVGLSVRHYGGNLSSLIDVGATAGEVEPGGLGHHIVVFRDSQGYDGQTYYYVADDPFLQHRSFRDAFRYQRIGYPLAIWAVSLGHREWRPAAMIAINLLAVMVVAYLSGLLIYLYGKGPSVWWALACAINPSLIISVQLDLAEPLATALSLAGLLLYLRRRVGWSALILAVALLTREVAVLFILPLLIAEIAARRVRGVIAFAATAIPYLVWQFILVRTLGSSGAGSSGGNFGMPLAGIGSVLSAARKAGLRTALVHDGSILAVIVLVVVAIIVATVQLFRKPDVFLGGIITHGVAALFAAEGIWIAFSSAARVFGGLYPLTIFAYTRHRTPAFAVLAIATVVLTAFTFVRLVAITPAVPYYLTP